MRPRLKTLYSKIFLWFCLTIALTFVLVIAVAGIAGSQPFGRRWMALTQDLYAHSAVDFYVTGGPPALAHYLDALHHSSTIEGHLLRLDQPDGADLLGYAVPKTLSSVMARTRRTGQSTARLGAVWSAASEVTGSDGKRYLFVMEVHPLRGFFDGTFAFSVLPRVVLGLIFVALFCLMLARHITQPIRLLQAAASRLAKGDLTVRTRPALAGRNDELSAMAEAFDAMAGRIETLLGTERQMLAEISHELRSPLTRIGVSLELLRRGEQDVIEPMQVDLDRLNDMIGDVLGLMRFDMEVPKDVGERIPLNDLLAAVIANANLEGRGESKTVHLEAHAGSFVRADRASLSSAVENIVRNALQHTDAGADVWVSTAVTSEGLVSVIVRDEGPGVPDDALPHLFSPFFRVPRSRESHPHGSGLGLAIAARIIARHGGTVAARNANPHGLIVEVRLPQN